MKKKDFLKEPGNNEPYEEESEQRAEEEQLIENRRKQYFYYYSRLETENENINPFANRLVRSPYRNNFVKSPYGNNFVKSPYENNFVKSPYGNNFVKSPNVTGVQAKCKVSSPNDPCELEADRMAENVLNRKESEKQTGSHQKENRIKAKSSSGMTIDTETESRINGLGSGRSLPDSERDFYEQQFGADLTNVKIHDDEKAHELSEGINAKAFTKGNDIVFNKGEYKPETEEGKKLLAHELTHVVQQGGNDSIISRLILPIKKDDSTSISAQKRIEEAKELLFKYDLPEGYEKELLDSISEAENALREYRKHIDSSSKDLGSPVTAQTTTVGMNPIAAALLGLAALYALVTQSLNNRSASNRIAAEVLANKIKKLETTICVADKEKYIFKAKGGKSNVKHDHIVNEAAERAVALGLAGTISEAMHDSFRPNLCEILRSMAVEASQAGDTKKLKAIEATMKALGCKHSSYSGNR